MPALVIAIYTLIQALSLLPKTENDAFDFVFDMLIALFLCSPLIIAFFLTLTVNRKETIFHYLRRLYAFFLIIIYIIIYISYSLYQNNKTYMLSPFLPFVMFVPVFMLVPLAMLWREISSAFKKKKYRIYLTAFALSVLVLSFLNIQFNYNTKSLTQNYPYPDDMEMIEHFYNNRKIFEELVHDFRNYREESDGGNSLDRYRNFIPYEKKQIMDQIKCARIYLGLNRWGSRWWYPDPYSDYTTQVLSTLRHNYNMSDPEQQKEIVEIIKKSFPIIQEGIAPITSLHSDLRRSASPIQFDYEIPEYERGVANCYGYRHRFWCIAITKGYLYFPFSPPRIENGRLEKPDFFSLSSKSFTLPGEKVLDSLDTYPEDFKSPHFYDQCFLKPIDAQWFLFLCGQFLGRPCGGKYQAETGGRFGERHVCLSREIPASHAPTEAP